MNKLLRQRDTEIWLAARPWLDVRSNDEHTLISYRLGIALLRVHPDVEADIVLPAILLHDVGWKMFSEEKLTLAIGPNAKYPELQRAHEIESVRISRSELERLGMAENYIGRIVAIVDGHDTRPRALSREDALMKDADKLWRFTPHGIACLSDWFETPPKETVAMLESYVTPKLITEAGRTMAQALLANGAATAWVKDTLGLTPTYYAAGAEG